MKNILIIALIITLFTSCDNDKDNDIIEANITFSFDHTWDDTHITNTDFNTIQYTNANGEEMSIEKLRYLISKITFEKTTGEVIILEGYNLVDVTNNENLTFTSTTTIETGTYSNVSFTFGFDNDDNYNQTYTDLNSASWNVPDMLGGGYHFMQLEGKFINNEAIETGYAYHTIRAVDNSGNNLIFQDTFFEVDLGEVTITNDATCNIEMNIAEWFTTPNTWDLNVLNNVLMPNLNAQVMMHENGQNVFSLESVTQ